jgi:hypothetical protein
MERMIIKFKSEVPVKCNDTICIVWGLDLKPKAVYVEKGEKKEIQELEYEVIVIYDS